MEMPIPKPRSEVIVSLVIAANIAFVTILAIRSLFVGIAIIPSAIWLSLVALHLYAAVQAEGVRNYWIGILSCFSSKHFVEQFRNSDGAPAVRFGFRILTFRLFTLSIPVESIRSVNWSTGQLTHRAGRDMNDWQVWLWYERQGNARNEPELINSPGQTNYSVGTSDRREVTAAFGAKFLTFLQEAGANLVQSDEDCTYETIPTPSGAQLPRWPAYSIVGFLSLVLTVLGFIGLWLCSLFRERYGLTETEFMETTAGQAAIWLFSGGFLIGLFILFPVSISMQRRAGVPIKGLYGLKVPTWIAWPIVGVAMLIISIFILGLGGFLIWWAINGFRVF